MILSLLTLASTAAAQSAWTVGQTVQTTSGQVKGHVSAWKPAVSEYLGVPYAQPPLGALRFAAPQPFRGTREIDAREFGASCPANIEQRAGSVDYSSFAKTLLGILGQVGDRFDEDCLTLNVWAKPDGKKKAVLVWIYGGGFGSGNSRSPSYNGARLVSLLLKNRSKSNP
jgi:carboxylesterase type B